MKESSANVTARTIGIDLSQETSTYVSLGAEGDLLPVTEPGILLAGQGTSPGIRSS